MWYASYALTYLGTSQQNKHAVFMWENQFSTFFVCLEIACPLPLLTRCPYLQLGGIQLSAYVCRLTS